MSDADPHALFTADWLSLREPADHGARGQRLTDAAALWLTGRGEREHADALIVDLGCGSGSNLRYLAPRLPGPQRWRLVDHDADLLERAVRSCQPQSDGIGQPIAIETLTADLRTLAASCLNGARLVTAAALLDLVDTGWIERLVADCLDRNAALLITLSVDGRIGFIPATAVADDNAITDEDRFIFALLAEHQRRDKGFGRALGTEAPAVLVDTLERAGFNVDIQPSDWHLDAGHVCLATALIAGWREAACQQQPAATRRIDTWARRRSADIANGHHALRVGHQDIFATPPLRSPAP